MLVFIGHLLNIVARCLRMIYITNVKHVVGFLFCSGRQQREGEHHPASGRKKRVALPRNQNLPPALNQTLAKTVTRYVYQKQSWTLSGLRTQTDSFVICMVPTGL